MPAHRKSAKKGAAAKADTIKKRDTYEALLNKGYSQEKSARIANAQANGTLDYRGGRGKRKGGKKK